MTRHLRTYRSTSLRWTVFVPPQSGMFRKADGRFIYIQLGPLCVACVMAGGNMIFLSVANGTRRVEICYCNSES